MVLIGKHSEQRRRFVVDKAVVEGRVPVEAAEIDLAEPVQRCYADFVWRQPHNRAMLLMGRKDGACLAAHPSLPPDPGGEDGGGEVRIWDLGGGGGREAGEEDAIDAPEQAAGGY